MSSLLAPEDRHHVADDERDTTADHGQGERRPPSTASLSPVRDASRASDRASSFLDAYFDDSRFSTDLEEPHLPAQTAIAQGGGAKANQPSTSRQTPAVGHTAATGAGGQQQITSITCRSRLASIGAAGHDATMSRSSSSGSSSAASISTPIKRLKVAPAPSGSALDPVQRGWHMHVSPIDSRSKHSLASEPADPFDPSELFKNATQPLNISRVYRTTSSTSVDNLNETRPFQYDSDQEERPSQTKTPPKRLPTAAAEDRWHGLGLSSGVGDEEEGLRPGSSTAEIDPAAAVSEASDGRLHSRGKRKTRSSFRNSFTQGLQRMSDRVVGFADDRDDLDDDPHWQPADRDHRHQRLGSDDGEGDDAEEETEESRYETAFKKLRGKSLGVFGESHWLRRGCAKILISKLTEPVILVLILASVVVLTIQTAPDVYDHPRPKTGYFHDWTDYALLGIFSVFTAEMFFRIVVTGLIVNPPAPVSFSVVLPTPTSPEITRSPVVTTNSSRRDRSPSRDPYAPLPSPSGKRDSSLVLHAVRHLKHSPVSTRASRSPRSPASTIQRHFTVRQPSLSPSASDPSLDFDAKEVPSPPEPFHPSRAANTSTTSTLLSRDFKAPFSDSFGRQRDIMYSRAYLRHSWNRLDVVAVFSFWIAFGLSIGGIKTTDGVYLFRAMSVLRSMRLLGVTTGTSTILHSLKRASPQLTKVGFFVAFAMILFSIIGIQSFGASYSRHCRWIDPAGVLGDVDFTEQACGGYYNATTGIIQRVILASGAFSPGEPKGYTCPPHSVCIMGQNPDNGALSFDNIFASMYQMVIIASANTWTVVMYRMVDADAFPATFFFIIGVIVLNYWLWNLLVAVITSTFAAIREETEQSAFSATADPSANHSASGVTHASGTGQVKAFNRSARWVAVIYRKTSLIWVLLALFSIVCQGATTYDMPANQQLLLSTIERYVTLAFGVEIVLRFYATFPDWRSFLHRFENLIDLGLVIVTAVIQIPVIKHSEAYPWLTAFQIARFYRVIMAIPRMNRLLRRVIGTFTGLLNMSLFLLLMTGFASLIGSQLFRGIPDPTDDDTTPMIFSTSYNSYLAVYQILSSENWTDVANNVLSAQQNVFAMAVTALFMSCWMLFGFFVLINMFIAVINENFSLPEEEKRKLQIEAFEKRLDGPVVRKRWWHRLYLYKFDESSKTSPKGAPLLRTAGVKDFAPEEGEALSDKAHARGQSLSETLLGSAKRAFRMNRLSGASTDALAMEDLHPMDETIVYQGTLFRLTSQAERDAEVRRGQAREQRARLAAYIGEHPSYDKSLWLLSQKNPLRRMCQALVDPGYGEDRLFGRAPGRIHRFLFQWLIFITIVGSVVIAAIATPVYRRNYYLEVGDVRWPWFVLAECALGFIFVIEFLVKVIADGFLFGPNAYLRSAHNDLDFFVLITLLVNTVTALLAGPGLNRFTRSLKAFRALRLINLWPKLRETFYSVLIVGFSRILDASLLAILYLIPFAVWAQNLFGGLLFSCNDSNVSFKAQCAGEYAASAVSDWNFLQPRVWDNPSGNPSVWSFDNFSSSLLILFEIISLEGWVDVMLSVMQITGPDQQPQTNAYQWSALFFVFFNLVGAVFILTLFVSTVIENFEIRSGRALLTTDQRRWLNLRRLLARQRPSKRPKRRPISAFRGGCFDRATQKHGWWSRSMTALYCANIIVLCTQATTNTDNGFDVRNCIFLGFTLIYGIDIFVRMFGLGWSSYIKNGWNQYDVVVVAGTFATTVPIMMASQSQAAHQLQKLFLVLVAFKLVQRNNSLNELFKTAVASLKALLNIFCLWMVLFIVWALFYIEVFGLTKWNFNETHNANYSTFAKALVLLALQSTGEGWNAFMHDYMVDWPRCTTSTNYLDSDCGSTAWALVLFITWNVLSMYLMANLILGTVIENFCHVYQSWGNVNYPNREEMRGFKRTWSEIDTERTGFIRRREIVPFLRKLTGIFEVRIYRAEWTIQNLRNAASVSSTMSRKPSFSDPFSATSSDFGVSRLERDASTIDTMRLAHAIRAVDGNEVRQRRYLWNRLYHEAMIEAEKDDRGISFENMLELLAHYRMIDDDTALQVDELLDRRQQQDRVMERVNSDVVRGVLQRLTWRRRFLAHRAAQKAGGVAPPEIRVQVPPSEPPTTPIGIRQTLTIDTNLATNMDDQELSSSTWPSSGRVGSPTQRRGLRRRGNSSDEGSAGGSENEE
ncbi:BQ2448_962 [Microbotryum intermedium]|uniref:Calcium-channel protein CCH1 n=1 Tax=Microbotryum intermedium TaxID=269621 RepID=A0A238F9Q0_9BASI|nr:BQ2448_962 [Microbotryum intermedium]